MLKQSSWVRLLPDSARRNTIEEELENTLLYRVSEESYKMALEKFQNEEELGNMKENMKEMTNEEQGKYLADAISQIMDESAHNQTKADREFVEEVTKEESAEDLICRLKRILGDDIEDMAKGMTREEILSTHWKVVSAGSTSTVRNLIVKFNDWRRKPANSLLLTVGLEVVAIGILKMIGLRKK